jgi:RNA polymerase sigma factor (sigma-70 family)
MKKRLANYRWVLMGIHYADKDLKRKEIQLEELKQIKCYEKTIKIVEEMRDRKIDELLKLYKEAEEIQTLIQTLRTKEKELVKLKYHKRLTWKKVAKEMNCSERTVKQMDKEIIKKLKERAKSDG